MPYYKGGHTIWLKLCDQVLNSFTQHPFHTPRQPTKQFQILAVLVSEAVPHLKGGSAALIWPLANEIWVDDFELVSIVASFAWTRRVGQWTSLDQEL
jgi:hypothetical protein